MCQGRLKSVSEGEVVFESFNTHRFSGTTAYFLHCFMFLSVKRILSNGNLKSDSGRLFENEILKV